MSIEKRNEEITISKATKGRIVRAVDKFWPDYQWVLLISHVELSKFDDGMYNKVFCHVTYCRKNGGTIVNRIPKYWSVTKFFQFYEPTEDDREAIRNILKNKNVRFVKIINKIIDR